MTIVTRFKIQRQGFNLDVDISLPACGVTAVFGPSGCGKTTLLRAIAGLEYDPNGYCKISDDIWQDGLDFLPTHRRPLGFVFQEASLFPHLTVQHNLEYGMKRVPKSEQRVKLQDTAELLGIEKLLNRSPAGLSGGERQRVAIARALLTSPRLLLMDEPLAALDRASKREILPYLERLHDLLAMPVLYVSHSAEEVSRLADHLLLLEGGRVRASGQLGEMLTRLDIAREQGNEAEAVIETTVVEHDPQFHIIYLEFAGGRFSVAGNSLPVGRKARLRVLARDVSLTLKHQTGTSILNIFAAKVEELLEESPSQVLVRLTIAGEPVLSRITHKSATLLELVPGKQVFAQIKAVALVD